MMFYDLGYRNIPLQTWMYAARRRATVPGMFADELSDWKNHMRSLVPVPWTHRGRIEVAVVLKAGQQVKPHAHDEWTLIYYVSVEHGVSRVEVDGLQLYPENDSAVLVPPGIVHAVPQVTESLRFSVAFRVYAHDDQWDLRSQKPPR